MDSASSARLAAQLLKRAERDEQAAHRIDPSDDVEAIRADLRRLGRRQGIRIRTGILDGTLVVVRADARLWSESTSVMRAKLTPPTQG